VLERCGDKHAVMRSRAPEPADAPGVLALITARDVADLGTVDFTLEDLRQEWGGDDVDLRADALLIEAGERIVGCGSHPTIPRRWHCTSGSA
jgi:hypothetical protein